MREHITSHPGAKTLQIAGLFLASQAKLREAAFAMGNPRSRLRARDDPTTHNLFSSRGQKTDAGIKAAARVFIFENRDFEMLTGFDQNTIANMTAALENVCKKIPADQDSHALRKGVADAMIACAKSGTRAFGDFQNAGSQALDDLMSPSGTNWLGRLFRFARAGSKLSP